ncbi:MAG: hypothetical protein V1934_03570 [Methanobacteriota archaeon]
MIPTTNLLRHALAGALVSLTAALMLFPAHAQAAAFVGAMSALMVNLDRHELPQGRRTPLGHSVAAWALWSYVASMVLEALAVCGVISGGMAVSIVLGVSLGYASHLILDAVSEEGIYTFPNREFPALEALPEGCRRQWAGWTILKLRMPQKSYILQTTNQ